MCNMLKMMTIMSEDYDDRKHLKVLNWIMENEIFRKAQAGAAERVAHYFARKEFVTLRSDHGEI